MFFVIFQSKIKSVFNFGPIGPSMLTQKSRRLDMRKFNIYLQQETRSLFARMFKGEESNFAI